MEVNKNVLCVIYVVQKYLKVLHTFSWDVMPCSLIDISNKPAVSFFRVVEKYYFFTQKMEYSSILKMEAAGSCETPDYMASHSRIL
jgi:hypothetical protein